jgi:hypothetical protein
MSAKTAKTAKTSAKKYGPRTDLGAPIDGYLGKLDGEHRAICDALVELIHAAVPGATAAIKWGMPMFSTPAGMLCYFRAQKEYVRFGFPVRGVALADPRGVLYGEGDGKHVRIDRADEIDGKRMTTWLKTVAKHVAAPAAETTRATGSGMRASKQR